MAGKIEKSFYSAAAAFTSVLKGKKNCFCPVQGDCAGAVIELYSRCPDRAGGNIAGHIRNL